MHCKDNCKLHSDWHYACNISLRSRLNETDKLKQGVNQMHFLFAILMAIIAFGTDGKAGW